MKILITGIAGFIGSYVAKQLVSRGDEVIGVDNLNDYYDVELKYNRLKGLGIDVNRGHSHVIQSTAFPNLYLYQFDLENKEAVEELFIKEKIDMVCHLAAQAGVRYSIQNPYAYIDSNVKGFLSILEGCRHTQIKHLVYASSSSVYGLNAQVPFSEKESIAHPVSLYAATKKSNELMAHAYSHLYKLPTTGLRFFTVYGPWGRPDMSPFLFVDAILRGKPINIFNNGDMLRDFTYIDDIVEGILRIMGKIPVEDRSWNAEKASPESSIAPYRVYNIGNSSPIKLMNYIEIIESIIGKNAIKKFLPMQLGDVYQTNADTSLLEETIGFKPATSLRAGLEKTIEWFKEYYKL